MGIVKRSLHDAERPYFAREDAWFLLEFPVLFAVATFVPERLWPSICFRLEQAKSMLGAMSPEKILRGMRLMKGLETTRDNALRIAATRSEHHLQIIREFFWGWSLPIDLVGGQRIIDALGNGHGAVLWVAHFSFNSLAAKKALHKAGFAVSHLSRLEHGFSKSRFGIAFLNPMRIRAERRYLHGRVLIDRAQPAAALHRARTLLRHNRIVSITAGAWEGVRVARVKIGECELDLSTGAPGLARLTSAVLLPVFAIRDENSNRIEVVVDEPISVNGGSRDEALLRATQSFAERISPIVAAHPLQWRDWEKIRPRT